MITPRIKRWLHNGRQTHTVVHIFVIMAPQSAVVLPRTLAAPLPRPPRCAQRRMVRHLRGIACWMHWVMIRVRLFRRVRHGHGRYPGTYVWLPCGNKGKNQLGCHVWGRIPTFRSPRVAPQLIRDGSKNKKTEQKRNMK